MGTDHVLLSTSTIRGELSGFVELDLALLVRHAAGMRWVLR